MAQPQRSPAEPVDRYDGQLHNNVVEILEGWQARQVIEIGFGEGGLASKLHEIDLVDRYLGVDISAGKVAQFNDTYRPRDARRDPRSVDGSFAAVHASAELLPLRGDQFDTAIAIHTLYWWASPTSALKELHRVLKPGGRLLVRFDHKSSGPGDFNHNELALALLEAQFIPQDMHIFRDYGYWSWPWPYAIGTAVAL